MSARACGDRGAATVAVVALAAVLLATLAFGAGLADLLAARQRAAGAADLAALAGVPAAVHGDDNACRVAVRVAVANGAIVRACSVLDGDVWVTAAVRPRSRLARWVADRYLDFSGPAVTAHAGLR